eukprot:6176770-Pleurochrysis_carterae.AAC.1
MADRLLVLRRTTALTLELILTQHTTQSLPINKYFSTLPRLRSELLSRLEGITCIRSSLNHLTCVSVAVIESFAWERSSLCFSERVALQTTESPLSTKRDPWHPQSDRKALHPPRCILLTNDKAVNHSVGVKRTHSPTSGASSSSIVKAPSTASVSSCKHAKQP